MLNVIWKPCLAEGHLAVTSLWKRIHLKDLGMGGVGWGREGKPRLEN